MGSIKSILNPTIVLTLVVASFPVFYVWFATSRPVNSAYEVLSLLWVAGMVRFWVSLPVYA